MANNCEKVKSILAGNLNSGLNYVITTVHKYVKFSNVADWCKLQRYEIEEMNLPLGPNTLWSHNKFSILLKVHDYFPVHCAIVVTLNLKTLEQESFKREIQNYFF